MTASVPPPQLSEILKFGVDKLLSSDESSVQEVELEKILGASRGGQWVEDEVPSSLMEEPEEEENPSDADGQSGFEIFVMFSHRGAKRSVVTLLRCPTFLQTTCTTLRGKITARTPAPTTRRASSV